MSENDRRDMLMKEYGEVASSFRLLTDIRFKLLAVLPLAAAATAIVLDNARTAEAGLIFSLFGLVVTLGLVTYNSRNDQLYDTLIGRAASIERQLGDFDGAFSNRPRAWRILGSGKLRWRVDHRMGVATVYTASIGLWLFGVFNASAHIGYAVTGTAAVPSWIELVALCLAIILVSVGAAMLRSRKESLRVRLRNAASNAVHAVNKLPVTDLAERGPIRVLAELGGISETTALARVQHLSQLPHDEVVLLAGEHTGLRGAANLVSYVVDLPPEWVYDCATGRRQPSLSASNDAPSVQ